jgi:hypothetical protein
MFEIQVWNSVFYMLFPFLFHEGRAQNVYELCIILQDSIDMIKKEHDAYVLSEESCIDQPCLKKEESEVSHFVRWYVCSCGCVYFSNYKLQCGMNSINSENAKLILFYEQNILNG